MRNNEMNPEKSVTMNKSEINQYFKEFLLALDRKVHSIQGFRLAEADDFKSYCSLWLVERPHLMSQYLPHVLASVCAGQRAVDFFRKMNSQLPQGKWVKDSEAIERKTILYLDKILDSERGQQVHQDFLASGEDVEAGVVNNLMLGSMLKALTPRQREVYLLVEIEGHKVVEAADVLGMRRELAQIELGKARKVVAELREEFGN